VRLDLLTPSRTETHCPHKGTATHWHLDVNGHHYDDFVWIYRVPLPESQKIAGLAWAGPLGARADSPVARRQPDDRRAGTDVPIIGSPRDPARRHVAAP